MRWIKIPLSIFLALCFSFNNAPLPIPAADAREMSKAGEVFQKVQAGVVTVFTGAGHGSGFLADDSGLVVTNSHVVNEKAGHLRVKFGRDQIVEAIVVENDREHDVAILRVNLKNIGERHALHIYDGDFDSTVLVGEQILVIGSPINKDFYEKTMTLGTIGRFDGEVIVHDAETVGGNSGGPVLNFDGEVVGIQTFSEPSSPGKYGPRGAVPAKYILKNLSKAKLISSSALPSEELLPDVPKEAYPISKLLKTNPEFFTEKRATLTSLHSPSFKLDIRTPPQQYKDCILTEDAFLRQRKARAKRKNFSLTADEFSYLNKKYYEYDKPVVTIKISPKTKLTEGTKARNASLLLGAATLTALSAGALAPLLAVPLALPQNQEIKKDFLRMALVGEDGQVVAMPIETGRESNDVFVFEAPGRKNATLDRAYVGRYAFDATAFDTTKTLSFVVAAEGSQKIEVVKLPEKMKQQILTDFRPYWSYVAQNKPEPPPVKMVSTDSEPRVK